MAAVALDRTPGSMANKLGAWITRERQIRDWTLRHLGELSGISHATLSRIERGLITDPSADTLKALSRVLGVSVGYLETLAAGKDPDREARAAKFAEIMDKLSPEAQAEIWELAVRRLVQTEAADSDQ